MKGKGSGGDAQRGGGPLRAVIYARYSSEKQRPASIEDQVRACRAEIARRGWREVGVYSDREIAGTVARARPDYQRLLKAARSGEFDVLVVDELSRLTRDPEDLAGLKKRLEFWRIGLVAVADGLDTVSNPQAAGPIMLLKGLVNEQELEANAHRSRRGLEGRALRGLCAGGGCYGYRTRPVQERIAGEPEGTGRVVGQAWVVHDGEAVIVRRIFKDSSSGRSTRALAEALNAEGVPGPSARWPKRQGLRCTWSRHAVNSILKNERYLGKVRWNLSRWPRDPEQDGRKVRRERPPAEWIVVEVPDLAIVSQELWESAQRELERRSSTAGKATSHKRGQRLLSGKLICGKCGARMVLRGRNTYSCATRQNRGDIVCDSLVTVPAEEAERRVLDLVPRIYSRDFEARLQRQVSELLSEWNREAAGGEAIGELRALKMELTVQARRLVEALKLDDLTDEIKAELARVNMALTQVAAQLRVAEAELAQVPVAVFPPVVRAYLEDLPKLVARGEVAPLREALDELVGAIHVHAHRVRGRKRPAARLVVQGRLSAEFVLDKVKTGGSPGGILPPLTFQLPPRVIALRPRQGSSSASDGRQRAVAGV